MHEIEPYYGWRDYYIASSDKHSPFYGRQYSELHFIHKIYNYYIHPQWDDIGSSTLYAKLLYADYEQEFAVLEFIGEWNDAVHNDVMELKRSVVDPLIAEGIRRFVLIGENVLNFHASDELYYEEWYDDIKDDGGWIIALNFREHVLKEMQSVRLHYYMHMGPNFEDLLWRKFKPRDLPALMEGLITRSLQ